MQTFEEIKNFLEEDACIECAFTVDITPRNNDNGQSFEAVDKYVTSLGFKPIGKAWKLLDKESLLDLLAKMCHKSMAYSVEMMSMEAARQIAEAFVAQFNPTNALYFANGSISEGSAGWTSITKSTMEMAIVVMDSDKTGIICCEDED